jgi:protein TonB
MTDLLASLQSTPNWEMGGAIKASPVGGGHARTTYLSILVGLVKRHMHMPAGPRRVRGVAAGVIAFQIDRTGRVMMAKIVKRSGEDSLDIAALTAIRSASPFPPTPTGTPLGLTYSYSAE